MSTPIKNWKGPAFQALADYYKVEAERASYEERLEKARAAAERVGVSWRYGSPSVEGVDQAYSCACGAVIAVHYGDKVPAHCRECIEKTRAAVEQDQQEEANRAKVEKAVDAAPKPAPVVERPPEEVPF